jgi:hypothetical protein
MATALAPFLSTYPGKLTVERCSIASVDAVILTRPSRPVEVLHDGQGPAGWSVIAATATGGVWA